MDDLILPVTLAALALAGILLIVLAVMLRRARRELRSRGNDAQQRQQAQLLDQIHDAVISTDLDGYIQSCNAGSERMTGYSAEEMLGRHISMIYPPDQHRFLEEEVIGPLLAQGSHEVEARLQRKNGETVWIALRLSLLHDEQGRAAGMIGYAMDITERKALEEALRQAQKMEAVGRLAGGVAHDFNNILTAISGYSEMLLGSTPAADRRRADLEQIRLAAERAARLIRQLLAFSRRQVLQPRVLDLSHLVCDMEAMLRRLIGEDIELVTALEARPASVHADQGQLEQVLLNLAVNARHAMPSGGRLTLATRGVDLDAAYVREHPDAAVGAHVLLEVADTGVGMDSETRAHVFEPFFTTRPVGEGTGLGLATVYGIVRQSGGHVTVESGPGRGTVFRIYLPRVEPDAP